MNPKVSPDHLKRRAIVYIRQSSPGQVIHNQESQRRQYGLADHARQLGFQQVEVILGRALMKSAAGDRVILQAPAGTEHLTVLEVCYERISVEPFREPPGAEASAKGLPRRPQST